MAAIDGSATEHTMEDYKVINLDQEPDTMAFVPSSPDHIIVGTYSLLSRTEQVNNGDSNDDEGNRKGSLQILPVQSAADHQSNGLPEIFLARRDFPFGIYDIHFHPREQSLLGVATSNAEILFYRVTPQHSPSGLLKSIELVEVGKILVEEPYVDDGRLAIITQFRFLELDSESPEDTSNDESIILAATTQFGNTKFIKVTIPCIGKNELEELDCQIIGIHKQSFDLEAWTVLPIFTDPSTLWLLSGGDDSQLIMSSVILSDGDSFSNPELDLDLLTPTQQHIDKRNHEAGVVYICTLGTVPPYPKPSTDKASQTDFLDYLILTGSYDETLRLFTFTPPKLDQPKTGFFLASELNLGGGVWRIIPLDSYETESGREHILLVAAHTAGACIVRLSCFRSDDGNWTYEFTIEKSFKEGHESIVYAVCAKRMPGAKGAWDIVSASFYDKVVCEWKWVDEKAGGA